MLRSWPVRMARCKGTRMGELSVKVTHFPFDTIANCHIRFWFSCTALHYACMNHNDTLLSELLKLSAFAGAVDDAKNDFSLSPMAALFWNGPGEEGTEENQNKCLELLLDAGADPNCSFWARRFDFMGNGYGIEVILLY